MKTSPFFSVFFLGVLGIILLAPTLEARSTFSEGMIQRAIRDVILYEDLQNPEVFRPAEEGVDILRGSMGLRTGLRSRAELLLNDQSLVRIGSNAVFSFAENQRDLFLSQGTMLLQVPPGQGRTTITTQNATAAITGTTVLLDSAEGYTKLIVLEGTVTVTLRNRLGERITLRAGQMLIWDPNGDRLPEPVDIDLAALKNSSDLVKGFDEDNILDLREIEQQSELQERLKEDGFLEVTSFTIPGRGTTVYYGLGSGGLGEPTFNEGIQRETIEIVENDSNRLIDDRQSGQTGEDGESAPADGGTTGGGAPGPVDPLVEEDPIETTPNGILPTIRLAPNALGSNSELVLNPQYFEGGEFVGSGYLYTPGGRAGTFTQLVFGAGPTAFENQIGLNSSIDQMIGTGEEDGMAVFAFDQLTIQAGFAVVPGANNIRMLTLVSDAQISLTSESSVFLSPNLDFIALVSRSGGIYFPPASALGPDDGAGNLDILLYSRDPNSAISVFDSIYTMGELSLFSAGSINVEGSLDASTLNVVANRDISFGDWAYITASRMLLISNQRITLNPTALDLFSTMDFELFTPHLIIEGNDFFINPGVEGPMDYPVLAFYPGFNSLIEVGTGGIEASGFGEFIVGITDVDTLRSAGNVTIDLLTAQSLIEITGNLVFSDFVGVYNGDLTVSGAITQTYSPFSSSMSIELFNGNLSAGSIDVGAINVGGNIDVMNNFTADDFVFASGNVTVGGDLDIWGFLDVGGNLTVGGLLQAEDVYVGGDLSAHSVMVNGALEAGDLSVQANLNAESVVAAEDIYVGGDMTLFSSAVAGNELLVDGMIRPQAMLSDQFAESLYLSSGRGIAAQGIDATGTSGSIGGDGGVVEVYQEQDTLRIRTGFPSTDGFISIGFIQADGLTDTSSPDSRDGGFIRLEMDGGVDDSIEIVGAPGSPGLALSARSSPGTMNNTGTGGTIEVSSSGLLDVDRGRISVGSVDEVFQMSGFSAGEDVLQGVFTVDASTWTGGEILLESKQSESTGIAIQVRNSSELLALVDADKTMGTEEFSGMIRLFAESGSIDIVGSKLVANKGKIDVLAQNGPVNVSSSILIAEIINLQAMGANGNLYISNSTLQAAQTLSLSAAQSIYFSGNNFLRSGSPATLTAGADVTVNDGVTRFNLSPIVSAGGNENYELQFTGGLYEMTPYAGE